MRHERYSSRCKSRYVFLEGCKDSDGGQDDVIYLSGMLANAASFDCSKANSPASKLICSDPQLSKLDEVMAATYKQCRSQYSEGAEARDSEVSTDLVEVMVTKLYDQQ